MYEVGDILDFEDLLLFYNLQEVGSILDSEDLLLFCNLQKALERLHSQPKETVKLAIRTLSILYEIDWSLRTQCSSITIDQLQVAVAVRRNQTKHEELKLPDKSMILDICAGFITVSDSGTIRISDAKTSYFLVQHAELLEMGEHMAIVCATYLSLDVFDNVCKCPESFEARYKAYPFFDFAAYNLPYFILRCDEHLTTDVILRLLGKPGNLESYLQAEFHCRHLDPAPDSWDRYPRDRKALHVACSLSHYEVVKKLVADGAEISAQDSRGETALFAALYHKYNGQIFKFLLDKGADFTIPNGRGSLPLHEAAGRGYAMKVQWLLEKGADVTALDGRQGNALHEAASSGSKEVVEILLNKDSSLISVPDHAGWTPLHLAALEGHRAAAELLLERGADFTLCNREKWTPLHAAASEGRNKTILLLLETGADIMAEDIRGSTAQEVAESRGYFNTVLTNLRPEMIHRHTEDYFKVVKDIC